MEEKTTNIVKNIGFAIMVIGFAMLSIADSEGASDYIDPDVVVASGYNESDSFTINHDDNYWEMELWVHAEYNTACEDIDLSILDSSGTLVYDGSRFCEDVEIGNAPNFNYIYGETYYYESNYPLTILMHNINNTYSDDDVFGIIGSVLCCSGILLASFSGGIVAITNNQKQFAMGIMPSEGTIPQTNVEGQDIRSNPNQTYLSQPTFSQESNYSTNETSVSRSDSQPKQLDLNNSHKEGEQSDKKPNFWDNI